MEFSESLVLAESPVVGSCLGLVGLKQIRHGKQKEIFTDAQRELEHAKAKQENSQGALFNTATTFQDTYYLL